MSTREHIPNVYRIEIGGYTREFARDDLETAALLLLEFRERPDPGSLAAKWLESEYDVEHYEAMVRVMAAGKWLRDRGEY